MKSTCNFMLYILPWCVNYQICVAWRGDTRKAIRLYTTWRGGTEYTEISMALRDDSFQPAIRAAFLIPSLALVASINLNQCLAASQQSPDQLFDANCASCHRGGGNAIGYARGKTLRKDALIKNNVADEESISNLIQNGKGVMPRYSEWTRASDGLVIPSVLSEDEIR
eukprot:CAMPEP_0185745482 /NCGR_PEP_ID=MMETSP1174-20130828/3833_1 /TAXON_ID=35687 /ORGANISM="Dictyocha speculum, Strain CCMP1381" /LENGTH=167 /DNA_ID=CAMNT_0028419513 /DNA_START=186 /DNA_END=685 /DNA_ORIENTATION=-